MADKKSPLNKASKEVLESKKLLGASWPKDTKDGEKLRAWIDARLQEQEPVMRDKRLHWARHRHFRQGRQWISSRDGRTWREVGGDKNTLRLVLNMIGPALDFRLGMISEQRPGFRTQPLGTGVSARETADAQQRVSEYYYNKLHGLKLMRDSVASAQTDGVSFLHVYIDKHAGPTREDVKLLPESDSRFEMLRAEGYEVDKDGNLVLPLDAEGSIADAGTTVRRFSEGDIGTRVVLAHEVFTDPEAKTMNGPYDRARWCIIRRVRSLSSAKLETGKRDLAGDGTARTLDPVLDTADMSGSTASMFQRGLPPFPSTRHRHEDGIFEFLIYIAPNKKAGYPRGMWRRIIGDQLVASGNRLAGGKIPLARMTDGSSDSEMYPRPVMSEWIPDQTTINMLVSKLMEHIRVLGFGRAMAQKGTLVEESYSTIVGSLLEYQGPKPEIIQGSRVSGDVWNSLEFFVKKLEDKTGWNDLARGQVTGSGSFQDVSGRALLGARELFERQFGPTIRSTADGMTEWAKLVVDHARFLFDTPRLIPITGRGDLAKKIAAKDFGDDTVVYVDPSTLSPLPRALRNQMLFDLLEKGMIDAQTYRKNAPFAEIRDIHMGGTDQWERAQMINTRLEEDYEKLTQLGMPAAFDPNAGGIAILWQDDAESHKFALEEIALDEHKPLEMRTLALDRWGVYDQMGRAQTVDPNSGQPMGQVPQFVLGVPPDMAPQPPAPQAGGEMGLEPGATGQLASPTPEMGPAAPIATGQSAPALGGFGEAERAAQDTQEF